MRRFVISLHEQHKFLTIYLLSIKLCKEVSFIPHNPMSPFSLVAKPLFRTIRVSECVVVKFTI